MILLLDTNILIDALRNRNNRADLLAQAVRAGHTLVTSALNVGEVYGGMRQYEALRTAAFLGGLDCYPITERIARQAGTFQRAWAQKGRTLTLADMLVAATALEHEAALVTDNRKDFPLPELTFFPLPDLRS